MITENVIFLLNMDTKLSTGKQLKQIESLFLLFISCLILDEYSHYLLFTFIMAVCAQTNLGLGHKDKQMISQSIYIFQSVYNVTSKKYKIDSLQKIDLCTRFSLLY